MEYMTEQFDIDMRKADLYSKNAYMEYEFACEEAFLESPDDVEYIITEAAGNLVEKVKAVFKRIIEAIKKFFSNLIEKVKSFFSGNKEEKLKDAVSKNPLLGKAKVQVPNLKEIEDVCGKRAMLRKKMMAEYKKGTLTRDRFNELVEQSEKLGKRLKTVGIITVTVAAIVASGFGLSKVISNLKNKNKNAESDLDELEQATVSQLRLTGSNASQLRLTVSDEPSVITPRTLRKRGAIPDGSTPIPMSGPTADDVKGTEVAQQISKEITEEERVILQNQLSFYDKALEKVKKHNKEMEGEYRDTRKHRADLYDAVEDKKTEARNAYKDDIDKGMSKKKARVKYGIALDAISNEYDMDIFRDDAKIDHLIQTKHIRDKRESNYRHKRDEIKEKLGI